jgi:3-oxoacyl-[acyl-carrier protein] reductase
MTGMVTGASSGIGAAIACELAAAGADVVVHARARREAAEAVAERIRQQGRRSTVLMADLADGETHRPLVENAWDWSAGLDLWINNAGADVLTAPAAGDSFEAKLDRLWRIDVLATVRLCRLVGPLLKERAERLDRAGVILNMGWDQAESGMAGDSGEMFSTTKGAVMAFTRSLARSLAPRVRVNCLAPGWIRTAWGEQASEHWQARACRESLMQRWGTPRDVARAARFLCSPHAAFITGQIIAINGGRS